MQSKVSNFALLMTRQRASKKQAMTEDNADGRRIPRQTSAERRARALIRMYRHEREHRCLSGRDDEQ